MNHAVMSSATALMIRLSRKNITLPRSPSSRPCQLRFRLLQPVRHAHLAVHRRRGGEVLLRLLALVCAPVELAEAEVAVGDEGAHAELFGQTAGAPVVLNRRVSVRGIAVRRDLAE